MTDSHRRHARRLLARLLPPERFHAITPRAPVRRSAAPLDRFQQGSSALHFQEQARRILQDGDNSARFFWAQVRNIDPRGPLRQRERRAIGHGATQGLPYLEEFLVSHRRRWHPRRIAPTRPRLPSLIT